MEDLETRLSKIKRELGIEGIEIEYTITPSNQPLLILTKGNIILGNTKIVVDEESGDTINHWERVYLKIDTIIDRRTLTRKITFNPFILPYSSTP